MDRYTFFQLLLCIGIVWGHGRMIEPPMRSSMWRYGFQTPKNYNDNELNCGGFAKMMEDGGRCGPCGDPWFSPRDNEAGGKYATGTIGRHYAAGQIINVTVELTSNHNGYFEFRLCPHNNPSKPVTQACLNRNVLNIMGYGRRYRIETKDSNMFMEFQLTLPPGLTCSQCVLQWKWRAAQNRGVDGKGKECFGCGPQEHFINCADISIGSRSRPLPLNRPNQRGVHISKTGPKTQVAHTPAVPSPQTTKSSKPEVYDPSVMEPPTGAYSNAYSSPSAGRYNNIHKEMSGPRQQYQPRPSPQYRQPQPTYKPVTKQVPLMSNQMSYESMIDSKNQITALVLQYMSSLPMEVAMESAAVECDNNARPICKAIPMWNNNRPFDEWCSVLCPTGVCPAAVCSCTCPSVTPKYQQNNHAQYSQHGQYNHHASTIKCKSMTAWGDHSMDQWCTSTCNSNPDNCPSDHCWCDGL